MSSRSESVFFVTSRLRARFRSIPPSRDDILGSALSLKNLKYLLRVELMDHKLRASQDLYPDELSNAIHNAQIHFTHLLKQIDFYDSLPSEDFGTIRRIFNHRVFLYQPESTMADQVLNHECEYVSSFISSRLANFVVYPSRWGITLDVSVPVINIVVPECADIERVITLLELFPCFSYETVPIRFATGTVNACGRVWYYPRVPLGSSISSFEDGIIAGGFGLYVRSVSDQDDTIYALTAGHVADLAHQRNNQIQAPASKPCAEARKSLSIGLSWAIRYNDVPATNSIRQKIADLDNLQLHLGDVKFCSTRTSTKAPYFKEDFALLEITKDRAATNQLKKIPLYRSNQNFAPGADIPNIVSNPSLGTPVCKVGIRTGYTEGKVGKLASVRWDPDYTRGLSPTESLYMDVPVSQAHTIIGDDSAFADSGDSGSLVVAFQRSQVSTTVVATEAVGILYANIENEDGLGRPTIALYYPIADIFAKIREELGITLELDTTNVDEDGPWPYQEHGDGRSMPDLK